MKLVNEFLARFQNLTPPDDSLKRVVVGVVNAVAHVPLKKQDVSISNGVVFINCSSIAKSAIHLKRGAILEELFQEMPKARGKIRDIR